MYSFRYIRRIFSGIGLSINTKTIYGLEPVWREAINLSVSLPLEVTSSTITNNMKVAGPETSPTNRQTAETQ
jgi:hypothetical protein